MPVLPAGGNPLQRIVTSRAPAISPNRKGQRRKPNVELCAQPGLGSTSKRTSAPQDPVNESGEAPRVKISAEADEQEKKHKSHNCRWTPHQNRKADQRTESPETEDDKPASHSLGSPAFGLPRTKLLRPTHVLEEGRNVVR